MAKLDRNKWISNNPYEFINIDGNLFAVDIQKETLEHLPDNSATKFLLKKLRNERAI